MASRSAHLLIVLAAAGSAACREPAVHEKALTPVVVRAVASYDAAAGVRYSGVVEPLLRVDVAFKAGGYVQSLLQARGPDGRLRDVQEGDAVGRGVVLATVRDADYQEKRKQALSQLREAEVAVAHATEEYERAARLYATKSVTKTEHDGARTRLDVMRAKLDGARALVQEAENAIGDTSLRSPIDGLVMRRLVEVGSLAGPGTPGYVLADTRQVKVVFGAPDDIVNTLKLGAAQPLSIASVPGRPFRGVVSRIAPVADPRSRVFDVEITLPNADGRLKVGMVASLEVGGERAAAPVVVPLAAIVRAPGDRSGYAVFVVEDRDGRSVARVRIIELGQAFGNSIAVVSGLAVGERVVVVGATLIADGEAVRVAES
jgi:multidrug efflux system membrane fusion protein